MRPFISSPLNPECPSTNAEAMRYAHIYTAQSSERVSICSHPHITSNHRRGDTHASTRRSTRCSTDSAVVVDHPEQSTHAPVTTMSCDGAACGAQHRVHPHRQSRRFPTPSALRSSTSPHPCTRTELRRVRTPNRDRPSNHPRWGRQCLACHQMSCCRWSYPTFHRQTHLMPCGAMIE
jgi:hypothetical protein